MIGELSSALPAEGGYYAWVRRGLGNFWGFQEAWLSLAASIFDMAIYPTLFGIYLKQMSPWFGLGNHALYAGLFVVVTCAILNLAGIRVVGLTSLWLFFLLSLPFALVVVLSPLRMGSFGGGVSCRCDRSGCRGAGRGDGGDVELHGMGQRIDDCTGSGTSAEDLSEGNDRCGHSGFADIHPPLRCRVL